MIKVISKQYRNWHIEQNLKSMSKMIRMWELQFLKGPKPEFLHRIHYYPHIWFLDWIQRVIFFFFYIFFSVVLSILCSILLSILGAQCFCNYRLKTYFTSEERAVRIGYSKIGTEEESISTELSRIRKFSVF